MSTKQYNYRTGLFEPMPESKADLELIHDAAVIAGVITQDEELDKADTETCLLILREMRAVTETARLARAIARIYTGDDKTADLSNL